MPAKECWKRAGKKPIGVKWVDVNKEDEEQPEYRSRLVAKEVKQDKSEDLFVATPPLEAITILLSAAMTEGKGSVKGKEEQGMKMAFMDTNRAYWQADAKREMYVELPAEDEEEGKCAKLNKAMYGTRAAAHSWEDTCRKANEEWGFDIGKASPCIMHHAEKDII